jgi:hypothetical protein
LEALYIEFLNQIRATQRHLYSSSLKSYDPLWETVVQGSVGDCAFMAGTISLIQSHGVEEFVLGSWRGTPRIVDKGVDANGVRKYDVAFGNVTNDPLLGEGPAHPVWVKDVKLPTDAQLALYGSTTDHYLWLPVFERAYIQEWGERVPDRNIAIPRAMYDVAIAGETPNAAIKNLTWNEAKWTTIGKIIFPLNRTLESLIKEAFEDKKVILLGTRKTFDNLGAITPPQSGMPSPW